MRVDLNSYVGQGYKGIQKNVNNPKPLNFKANILKQKADSIHINGEFVYDSAKRAKNKAKGYEHGLKDWVNLIFSNKKSITELAENPVKIFDEAEVIALKNHEWGIAKNIEKNMRLNPLHHKLTVIQRVKIMLTNTTNDAAKALKHVI